MHAVLLFILLSAAASETNHSSLLEPDLALSDAYLKGDIGIVVASPRVLSSTSSVTCQQKKRLGVDWSQFSWMCHSCLHWAGIFALTAIVLPCPILTLIRCDVRRHGAPGMDGFCWTELLLVTIMALLLAGVYFVLGMGVLIQMIQAMCAFIALYAISIGCPNMFFDGVYRIYLFFGLDLDAGDGTAAVVFLAGCLLVILAPVLFTAMIFIAFAAAFPVFAKLHWYGVDRAIAFCAGNTGFSYIVAPVYAVLLIYKLWKACTARWQDAGQKVMCGLTVQQEWSVFQAFDFYTDVAIFVSILHRVPHWFLACWFLSSLCGFSLIIATSLDLLSYYSGLLCQVLVEDIPQLVLSGCMFYVLEDGSNQYSVYAMLLSFLGIVELVRKIVDRRRGSQLEVETMQGCTLQACQDDESVSSVSSDETEA